METNIKRNWCERGGACLAGYGIVPFKNCTHYRPLTSGGECASRGYRYCTGTRGGRVKEPMCNCANARREARAYIKKPDEEKVWGGGRRPIPITVIFPNGDSVTHATAADAAAAVGMSLLSVRWYALKGLVNKRGVRFRWERAAA